MNELLKAYLDKGHNSDHSYQATLHVTLYDPEKTTDKSFLLNRDKWASDDIQRLEEYIKVLKAYRQAIAERYQELETQPTIPVVTLKREKNYYSNKVFYYLIISRKYVNSGEMQQVSSTKYAGTDRKKAIDDFNSYVKSHPGIEAIKDIQKGRWEK